MKATKDVQRIRKYLTQYELTPYFSDELVEHMRLASFDKGENIVTLGDQMDYYYLHIGGKLKIYTLLENGKKVLIRFYSPLSVLGDLEYSFDFPCRAFVEALTPAELIMVPMDTLRELTKNNAEFLRFLNETVSKKHYTFSVVSFMNLTYPLENRVASYLDSISQGVNYRTIDEFKTCTLGEMADLLCTSYRHLSRVLNDFEQKGIIERKRGNIRIVDFGKLESYSWGLFE